MPHHADTTVAAVLELSDERDRWLNRILALEQAAYERERAGYTSGLSDGQDIGRHRLRDELAEDWRVMAADVPHGPTWAEVEERRWTVRGERRTRETFADPHPGDFPGRNT